MSYTNFKDNFSSGVSFLKKKISVTNLLEGEQSGEQQQQQQQPQQQPQQQQQQQHQQQQSPHFQQSPSQAQQQYRSQQQIPQQQISQQQIPQQQISQHQIPQQQIQQQQMQQQMPQQVTPQQIPQKPPPLPQRDAQQKIETSNPFKPQPPSQGFEMSHPAHQRFIPSSMTGTVQNMVKAASQAVSHASEAIKITGKRDYRTLLIIDEPHTDWSRMFYGRKLHEEMDLQVEQAQFSEINLTSTSVGDLVVEVRKIKADTLQRSFRPDFVLVRQHVKDATANHKKIILGLHYGRVPSINSLHSVYNFLDKPWVFSHLLRIQRRLGKNEFPLIEQCYYPNFKEMLVTPQFPVVVKIGHAHFGSGKIKVDSHYGFQDIASATALTNTYSTTELLVDSIYDIFIQKIGPNYKAFMRRPLTDNWKADTGSVVLEQVSMNDKYKMWVDECSRMFGGLAMLSLQVLQSRDDRQYIIEVNDSTMTLLGSNQSEDYKMVVDLVINEMKASLKPGSNQQRSQQQQQPGGMMEYGSATFEGGQRPPVLPIRPMGLQSQESKENEDRKDVHAMQNLKNTFAGIFSNM